MTRSTTSAQRLVAAVLEVGKWGFACALGSGCAWFLGIHLGRTLFDSDISEADGSSGFLAVELRATLLGVLVGSISAAVLLRPVVFAVIFWGPLLGVAAVLGSIMSGVATRDLQGVLPSQLSSSLGFAVGGIFAGLCGYIWRLAVMPSTPDAVVDVEDVGHPPSEAKSSVPVTRKRAPSGAFVRSLLIVVAAVSCLAQASLVASADVSLGVFIAMFGASVSISLWDQEQRLRALERQNQRNLESRIE